MNFILRFWAIFVIASKRLITQRGLVLASTLGLAVAISLTLSIPIYADAVYYGIFEERITSSETRLGDSFRPPFSFVFHYNGGWYGNKQWEEIQPADRFFKDQVVGLLNLPLKQRVHYYRTEPYPIFPLGETNFTDENRSIIISSFILMSDIEEHIEILEGTTPSKGSQEGPVEVMISEDLALDVGIQIGEYYQSYIQDITEIGTRTSTQIPIKISGIWRPENTEEDYWIFNPNNLKDALIVSEDIFIDRISHILPDEIYSSIWYMVFDGSNVHASDAKNLISRINTVQRELNNLLPEVKLTDSPRDSLSRYQESAALLTIQLYAFAIPILSLILAFISLVANLSIERQRNEIAILRSRGATTLQILGIVTFQSLILGLVAFAISTPLAIVVANLISNTRSFLDFSVFNELRINLTDASIRTGIVAMVLAIVAQVIPAYSAARQTIVSYKLEQARRTKLPWWQRTYLDFIIFIPAAYGTYLLREQGSLVVLEDTVSGDPFQNPLLFLVPALGVFALTLFILRIIPPFMTGIAWIAYQTKSIGILLAARHLSRTPSVYATPLILLILTLSLSAFTASLAQTLDNHLHDQEYYRVGSDMSFFDLGETPDLSSAPIWVNEQEINNDGVDTGVRWLFFPIYEYMNIEGVRNVARVGRFDTTATVSGDSLSGFLLGVDRLDFPKVSFWRDDFASASLGALMNALAIQQDGVLIDSRLMTQYDLRGGDTISLQISTYGFRFEVPLQVVGNFDLFPTWYPGDGPLFVGNIEYIFETAGSQYPYEVWLDIEPGVDLQKLADEELTDFNARIINWKATMLEINDEQTRPERQGLFGLLSIGFSAAALLTVLGFLLYAFFSFQRRFIELGVLRASGLSTNQMTAFLAWELLFLIGIGGIVGTVLGAIVSNLYIPYLQIGIDEASRIPPYLVEIAWPEIFQIYGLFGLLFLITLIILVFLLKKMRIFEAIKLGETV